jgi:hypothetical protein
MPTPLQKLYPKETDEQRRARLCANTKRHYHRNIEKMRAKDRARYAERREEVSARKRAAYAADRENKIATVVRWQNRNPEKVKQSQKERNLWRWYGLTMKDFESLFLKQGSMCPICLCKSPEGKNPWHVDHDHKTGQVRGILCSPCNLMLGHAKDNPQTLRAAIVYLTCKPWYNGLAETARLSLASSIRANS